MHITALFAIAIAVSASALPGLLYDKPHHTYEVLNNIHQTPYCAYTCIFDESYPGRFAPECGGIEGKMLGACLCRANGYQYMLDQCIALKCNKDERMKVIALQMTTHLRRGK